LIKKLNKNPLGDYIMANTISNSFVQQYKDSVYMNAELDGGKFMGKVREESIVGEAAFFETLSAIYADIAGAQFSDTPISSPTHDRRQVIPVDLEVGMMIDNFDKVKTLASFESAYVKRMVGAMMRKKDIEIIKGALGDAKGGKSGGTTVPFDYANQTIPVAAGSTASTGLNVEKLRQAKAKFWANGVNVEDPDMKLYVVCSGKQISDLLADPEVTSADYNTVKALVNGDVNTYMGFEFIRSELVPFVSGSSVELDWSATDVPKDTAGTDIRACFAYAKSALLVATNPDINTRVAERADKRFNWQAYASLGCGATRMEEKAIILIPADQSPA
jgi:hypothetical protein